MPVLADPLLAELDKDPTSDAGPRASQTTSPPRILSHPLCELPDALREHSLADVFGHARISVAEATSSTFASFGEHLVAETGVHRAIATQFNVGSAMPGAASIIAESLDSTIAIQADVLARVSTPAMTSQGLSQVTSNSAGLTIHSDLRHLSPPLAIPNINGLFPHVALENLLPVCTLGQSAVDAPLSTLHQLTSPLEEAIHQLTTSFQTAWRFDLARFFSPPLFPQLFNQFDHGLFRPGTLHGDLLVLLLPAPDPHLMEEAVRNLADQIPWRIRNPQVWQAIVTRAREEQTSVRSVKHRELCAAILLVLESRDVPQTLRFGRNWLTDDDGRKTALPPHELATRWFWQWLCNRAIAMAEAAVLERPFPATEDVLDRPRRNGRPESVILLDAGWERTDGGEALALLLVDESDPLTVLIAQHEHDEDAARLRAVLEVATPRQRQLLALIGAGHSEAAAARQLGLAPSTARVQLLHLRQKVM